MSKGQPIIIVKKKGGGGHGGHHGGAWKVAYADFVTALMAFFLVMWLVGQSPNVKAAVAGYFRDPGVFETTRGGGVLPGGSEGLKDSGVSPPPASEVASAQAVLEEAADHLRQALGGVPSLKALEDQIEISVTSEGLRIELLETAKSSFFSVGSSDLLPETVQLLAVISQELGKLGNAVALEGHTDSREYADRKGYGNWELSTDRANAARRAMERFGLRPRQINGVRGYADTRLRTPDTPLDAKNRRISIVVQNGTVAGV